MNRTLIRPGTTKSTARQAPAASVAARLLPPTFSLAPGTYPLSQYPGPIQLINPNPAGSSTLWYSVDSAGWGQYASPVTILPGSNVETYAETLDNEFYSDSMTASASYQAQKVTLQVGDNLHNAYSYQELGGPLASGSIAPPPMELGKLLLMNPDALPAYWENHDVFQMYWTKDGSNPTTAAPSRVEGNNTFQNTYPGDEVGLVIADWSSSNAMTFQYYAAGKNSNVVTSSAVIQKVINSARTPLLPPLVTPGAGSLTGTDPVGMILDLSGGQTPDGARIYYRTDGTDPGSGPEPIAGSLQYQGVFFPAPSLGPVVSIVARVYPPSNYSSWFVTSPPASRTYFLPYADKNVYGVLGGDYSIYVMDPDAGTNQLVNSTAPFKMRTIALDASAAKLYYTEEAVSGWRLGSYDIITNVHTILGSLATGRTYNATRQLENLACYNGSLYYIHDVSDDLVKITLLNNAISTVSKVSDVQSNSATFTQVGDMAVDDTGWMYFNDSNKRYYRYNLGSFSGFKRIGDTERNNNALAMYQGRLYAGETSVADIRRLSPAVGSTLSTKATAPSRKFVDFGSPTASSTVSPGSSLWVISDASDGPHLHQIRNYRSPVIAADIDYGVIYYSDNNKDVSLLKNGKSYIQGMCISSNGMLYFCRNYKLDVKPKDYVRPILKLNISNLLLGDSLVATPVGDLSTGLTSFAGTIDPDDCVTGISISPGGQLYGVLREGLTSGPGGEDFLFRLTQTAASMTGPTLAVTLVGKLTSALASSTQTEDLTFSPNGTLFATDVAHQSVYSIDSTNGSVLGQYSTELGSDYRAMAVDPLDYRLIACNYGVTSQNMSLMKVDGGDANDDEFINLQSLFGIQNVEAMAFTQGAFIITPDMPDLYAVDGSETIYSLDLDTGSTSPLTDAPFRLRALAYDFVNRRLFYLRNNAGFMTIGSYSLTTNTHTNQGSLLDWWNGYKPNELPDNLCYFGGFLWYVPPRTDDLVKIQLNSTGGVVTQSKAANITNDSLKFDLIGDLAVASDGWMYFTALNYEGQRFCRYKLPTLSNYEVISGPTAPTITGAAADFTEKWFDALAFSPPDATGTRVLFGSFASAPSPLRTVSKTDGSSVLFKPTIPPVPLIDFSDYHPGTMGTTSSVATPILAFSLLNAGYTYADVGGSFLPGLIPAPTPAPSPKLILANAKEIPVSQQNSATFTVHWTYDGTNPGTSSSVVNGPAFSNGMPSMPVAVDFAKWGTRTSLPLSAIAKTHNAQLVNDSAVLAISVPIITTELAHPELTILTNASGGRSVQITAAIDSGDCPAGTRIYYTTDGTDPGVSTASNGLGIPVSGSLYTGPISVPSSGTADFLVTARVYPPANLGAWFTTSISSYIEVPLGLAGGHMDVDTSHLLYPFRKGTTDGHVHQYDKRYNVVGESFFAFKNSKLNNIPLHVADGVKFKIIVANGDLSPGGRLVVNNTYNSANSATYIPVATYDNTALSALPIYSLNGIAGTTKLTQLGLYFDTNVISSGNLLNTVTGHVRRNNPGLYGEWRNGALTIQLVVVNPNGSDGFKTDLSISGGGVQGVATSGLLWETTWFWHGQGGPYGGSPAK